MIRATQLLATAALTAMLSAAGVSAADAGSAEPGWWEDAVFYQIFVRSFQDASEGPLAGDGVGDFQGLIERLDYLNDGDPDTTEDLGVDALWLLPIHPSPSYHGYDVTDYFAVNPDYGDLELFKQFLAEAHKRGIRVTIDLVLNHTSTEHPWFKEAMRQDIDSPYREYFVLSTKPLHDAGPWGEPAWHYMGGDWVYGVFWSGMPDWNFRNEDVVKHHYDVARFWLRDVGVDGFRLDAVRYFFEDGDLLQDTSETKVWLRDYQVFCEEMEPSAFVIGEVWSDTDQVASYVTQGSLDTAFEFDLAEAMIESAKFNVASVYTDRLQRVREAFGEHRWASFLSNHDKERTLSQLEGGISKAKLAATVQMMGEGVPFIYYGEEIGMTGKKPDPDLRTPMQWTDAEFAGFSSAEPWHTVNADYPQKNVEALSSDPESLLSHYRRLISARKETPSLLRGSLLPLEVDGRSLFAELRVEEDTASLVLINFRARSTKKWSLSLGESPLGADWAVKELLIGAEVQSPDWTDTGGFSDWKPFESLEGETGYLIRWTRSQ